MAYAAPSPASSGYTFTQLQAAGLLGLLEGVIAAQVATTAPTAAGTIATGTTYGGLLAPGVYYLNFTESNGFGETTVSAESASFTLTAQSAPSNQATGAGSSTTGHLPAGAYYASYTYVDSATGGETPLGATDRSAVINITATQILTITFNDTSLPTWASGRNVYLTAAGGAAGSETLYATGVTTSTYVASSASWVNGTTTQAAAPPPPTVNGTSTNRPVVTFPALQTNNTSRNLYLTQPGGATGSETLYQSGITTTTYTMTKSNSPSSGIPLPTANSTALSGQGDQMQFARFPETKKMDRIVERGRQCLHDFLRGSPQNQQDMLRQFREAHTSVALLNQAFTEAGVLVDANPGHLTTVTTGIGNIGFKRVWP
jgi:hypothetical protein